MENDHPLLDARAQAALTLLGVVCGFGAALVLAQRLVLIGLVLSLLGASGIVWLYQKQLHAAFKSRQWSNSLLIPLGAIIIAALPVYLFLRPAVPLNGPIVTISEPRPFTSKARAHYSMPI
jgi:hypothetical protein